MTISHTTIPTKIRLLLSMEEFSSSCYGSKEFYQSQRLFSLAFVNMLKQMGADYTMNILEETFAESTFIRFPIALTEENLHSTIMNFKAEEVKFK